MPLLLRDDKYHAPRQDRGGAPAGRWRYRHPERTEEEDNDNDEMDG